MILALKPHQIESFEDQYKYETGINFDWEAFMELYG